MNAARATRSMSALATMAALLAGALAAPVAAESPPPGEPQVASLRIEVAETLTQGTESEVIVVLEDSAAQPVTGEVVRLFERIAFFGYVDVVPVGEARTDYRGQVTLSYVPPLNGAGELTAELVGSDRFAPAAVSVRVVVGPGERVGGTGIPEPPAAILPRGVTDIWFLVLLIGVWSAIAAVVYNIVRIPSERGRPTGLGGSGRRAPSKDLLAGADFSVSAAWRAPPSEP